MQVTQLKNDGLSYQFKVVLPGSDVSKAVETKLASVAKQVKMPGFRPGKVPMNIVRDRYAISVRGEVVEDLVNKSTQSALKDKGLRAAVQPKIELEGDIFNAESDVAYNLSVEVLPTIEPVDVSSLALTRETAPVDNEAVEARLKAFAAQLRSTAPAPEGKAAENGDTLVIDFDGSVDGQRRDGMLSEGFNLELGSNSLIPGFEEQLVGMKAGETRTITVTFPADYHAGELANKEAQFIVKANEVKVPAPATLDDEFAKRIGAKDMADLREGVTKSLEADYASASRNKLKRALLDLLADKYSFEVPASMVEAEFAGIWKQVEADKAAGNLDADDKGKSDETLKTDYRKIAERRVRLGLLLAEISTQQKVQVTNQELQQAVRTQAMSYPGQEAQIVEFYSKNPQAVQSLQAQAFEDKVVDTIISKAKMTDKTVTKDVLMTDAG